MGFFFSPHEIAQLAMQVEQAGADFYKYLAGRSRDNTVKEAFLFLYDQELQHYRAFSQIVSEMKRDDAEREYSIDVRALLQNSVDELKNSVFAFKDLTTDAIDLKKCLALALHTEEEAVRIYTALYDSFIEEYHAVLKKIIDEEKRHATALRQVKEKLQM